jgi:peptidoglycan/LPS O-acetylase OafA/YrhL
LSYEVWYYIIFGCCVFSRGKWKALAPFAAIAIAGPNIVSLLPLWLMGAGCYYVCKCRIDKILGTAFCIVPLLLWIAYEIWAWHGHRLRGTELPWSLHRNEIIQDYIVGSLFALHIIGFNAVSSAVASALLRFSRQIRWAAGATFTIYLFHLPVAQFATVIVPWPPSSWLTRALMFPGMLAILFAIAAVTERRKEWWRRLFLAVFDPNLIPIALRSPSAKLD